MRRIVWGDNLNYLCGLESDSVNLIYIDPPFNTGKKQSHTRIKTIPDENNGDRLGFAGKRYRTIAVMNTGYEDRYDDYMGFLEPRLTEAYRILSDNGSLFFHIDYRESHYCKLLLDSIFGRESFLNEIIWAYDYGARSKNRWPTKHDTIFWYAKDPGRYTFNYDQIDRIPYMAPGLVGEEKALRGKTPTDVWWNTIVSTNGKERTGYATQKPLAILERIVKVHSNPNDVLLDFFAGSGTLGEAAGRNGRSFILVDNNIEAIKVMIARLSKFDPEIICLDQDCLLKHDAVEGLQQIGIPETQRA
ncbi:MAG: site-specific DNA-methyltransferase [Anaerolineales bacterium]|nr:site-specific DNA-methyltransferase [Anaerolineales bacterium]